MQISHSTTDSVSSNSRLPGRGAPRLARAEVQGRLAPVISHQAPDKWGRRGGACQRLLTTYVGRAYNAPGAHLSNCRNQSGR